ncbi:hypothetical protein JTB14_016340 [Gonioctena quinquepunctata]|nr:hypothetical protein JTB14_016340 [Gonioctena quinquepunctata]
MGEQQLPNFIKAETHLNGEPVRFPNYKVLRNDRIGRPGGGVAILVKRCHSHVQFGIYNDDTHGIEAVGIIFNTRSGPLRLISAYNPPRNRLLPEALDVLLMETDQPVLVMGDLNAKHVQWSRVTNVNGRRLREHSDRYEYQVLAPDEPTHFGPYRPDVLDIALARNITWNWDIHVLAKLGSDHNPVILSLGGDPPPQTDRMCTKVNWERFRSLLETGYCAPERIDSSLELDEAEPAPRFHDEFPLRIKNLIHERNRARRAHQRSLFPADRIRANELNREVRENISEFRNERFGITLQNLENCDQLWKINQNLKPKKTDLPPIHGEAGLCYDPVSKAQAFADSMERQFRLNEYPDDDLDREILLENRVHRTLREPNHDDIRPATLDELKAHIKGLNTKKPPGYDGITNRMIKYFPDNQVQSLLNIINNSLRLKRFPRSSAKLAEKIVLERLDEEVEDRNVLPNEQFGFRRAHSTELQPLTGFGKGLLAKLIDFHLPLSLIKWIKSFLLGWTFQVRVDNSLSDSREIEAGVPQGAVLSPILYALYTSDIPRSEHVKVSLFADDTALLSSAADHLMGVVHLQNALNELQQWYLEWKIKLNPEKTQAISMGRKRSNPERGVTISGREIEWSEQVKYLGVTLDRRLTWRPHVNIVRDKIVRKICAPYPLINRKSKLSLKNKVTIYKMMFRPVILYASAAWGQICRSSIGILERAQMRVLRMITNAPWYVRNNRILEDLNLPSNRSIIRERNQKVFDCAIVHENPLVREATDYNIDDPSRFERPRHSLE